MTAANSTFSALGTTIFEVMSRLAEEHQAVNLGQGFPDEGYPTDVLERAASETLHGWNQYPSMMGVPELRQAVAEHGARFYGLDLDWRTETMVTSGATEALAACLLGLIEPGDDVVLFQPLYDCYVPIVRRGGGNARFVTLRLPDWSFTREDLEAAFTERTRVVVLNDPLNPSAKVYSRDELELIASFAIAHDAVVVCDEVYEHLVYDGREHIPLMTLPGMRERCVKVGSAGKTFSLTGWKVGYVSAAPSVLQPVAKAHQFLTFTTPPNLQQAVAFGLRKDRSYFDDLATFMARQRDKLAKGLAEVGFDVLDCAGTYFIDVDLASLGWTAGDVAFCQRLVREVGVATVPLSAFYEQDPLTSVVRFCFCKRDQTIELALDRLDAGLARMLSSSGDRHD
ncbi:MAG: aminotransferase [Acidimicrobiia bacterium]